MGLATTVFSSVEHPIRGKQPLGSPQTTEQKQAQGDPTVNLYVYILMALRARLKRHARKADGKVADVERAPEIQGQCGQWCLIARKKTGNKTIKKQ